MASFTGEVLVPSSSLYVEGTLNLDGDVIAYTPSILDGSLNLDGEILDPFSARLIQGTGVSSVLTFGSTNAASMVLSGSGLQSADRFGPSTSAYALTTSGLASESAFGPSELSELGGLTQDVGVSSNESFGASTAKFGLDEVGFRDSESFGGGSVGAICATDGISNDEAFGTSTSNVTLSGAGKASENAFGGSQATQSLTSAAGIASGESFGDATLSERHVAYQTSGVAPSEGFGASGVNVRLTSIGLASQDSFGASSINVEVNALPLGSDESFGSDTVKLSLNSNGLGSDERFGTSNAVYDQRLTQTLGVRTEEGFGASGIPSNNNAADDYTNDAAVVAAKKRPLWLQRSRGSSSSSSSATAPVAVVAEMLSPTLEEGRRVKGIVQANVPLNSKIVVKARKIDEVMSKQDEVPIVEARMLDVKTGSPPQIVVNVTRVAKIA